MAETVSDFMVKRLLDWGIKRIYGYPGDGINGIMGALNRASESIEFVQVRHEEMAAFMACAHAKFTGEVGVCLATSGPGAIHLLNGLYDAQLDHQPVLAIVGQTHRSAIGSHYQQEVDLITLFKDVAHEYVQMASDPSQVRHLIDRAIRIAKAERCVTCVILPGDVQELEAVPSPERKHGAVFSGLGYSDPRIVPSVSGTLATMGPGMPYAIAAKFAFPDRPVVALVGDGSMQMGGNNELITVAKYWKQWRNPQLIVLVLNNHDLNQVTWEQRVLVGDTKFEASQNVPDFPYARYAESIGLRGIRVDSPDAVGPAWEEALAADRPVVYEAITDPNVPPLPPHITFEQAKSFAMSLFKGDPDTFGVIRQSFKDLVESYLPHGGKG